MAEQPKGNGPEHEVDIIRETELRYAGFATRVVRLAAMMRSARYLAFTSDVGEALRPVSRVGCSQTWVVPEGPRGRV
jgi:hypothetical protein